MVMKSISVKGWGCKFGGRAMKADVLTPGGLCRVPYGTGSVVRHSDRGAEVSRGHSSWLRMELMKARTVGSSE